MKHFRKSVLLMMMCWLSIAQGAAVQEALRLAVPDARPAVYPELASDGRGAFLLVWQQGRNYFEQQESDIYALRLDGAGRPIGQPISICATKGSQERPQVAFSNGTFIVVWQDLRNGRDWDVYAARVSIDGSLVDPEGVPIAGGAANQASPVIASAPGGALIAWQHYAGGFYELHAAFFSSAGKPAVPRALTFGGESLHGGDLALASFGDRWVMSWKDDTKWGPGTAEGSITRHFARLRLNGPNPEVLALDRAPAVSLGREGGRFASDLVGSALYTGWGDIGRGRRISVGAVFGTKAATALPNPNNEPEVGASSWNPRQVLTLFSTRVQIDGPVVAAFGDGAFLVVARESPGTKPPYAGRILASRISREGLRLDDADKLPVLHESEKPFANPAVAAGSDGFVLVYEQDDGPGKHLLMSRSVRFR
jgi:hypothetical protein